LARRCVVPGFAGGLEAQPDEVKQAPAECILVRARSIVANILDISRHDEYREACTHAKS